MRLTIIEDDGNQRIGKDADGNLYADDVLVSSESESGSVTTWAPIESYSVSFPEGKLSIPFIPNVVPVVRAS